MLLSGKSSLHLLTNALFAHTMIASMMMRFTSMWKTKVALPFMLGGC
jgi:hypothetical protein